MNFNDMSGDEQVIVITQLGSKNLEISLCNNNCSIRNTFLNLSQLN